jgi:diaminopimelate decarboxylase
MIENLSTPCWVVSSAAINTQVTALRNALSAHFASAKIGYSVKTNSLPQVLMLMRENGCVAEVVSADEWQLARLCGFDAANIIYNGPLKSRETFLASIIGGGTVNIETKRELQWLRELPASGTYSVGIRLNINLSQISAKDAAKADDNSRFGFSDDSNDLADAIALIQSLPNVRLSGLHLHRTTQARRVNYYRHVVKYAARIIRKYSLTLDYIDIGGGFYGTLPGKPSYEDYISAISETLAEQGIRNIALIVEPGTALIDSAVQFVAEVIDVKNVGNNVKFATINGSRTDIDPFFRKKSYICKTITTDHTARNNVEQQVVCGCTCIEEDRITRLRDSAELRVGDKIVFKHVGAYTMTLNPLFIRNFARVYLCSNNECKLIRNAWCADRIFELNTLT